MQVGGEAQRAIIVKLDVWLWLRLRGVRYAIYFKSIWRVVWRPAARSLDWLGQREGPSSIGSVVGRSVGRFFLFLGVGDLTRNLLGYKFVK